MGVVIEWSAEHRLGHAPPVVLLSPLRTQPPFTSVTLLIKGQGPSACQSATQHVYKASVYPAPFDSLPEKGLTGRKQPLACTDSSVTV